MRFGCPADAHVDGERRHGESDPAHPDLARKSREAAQLVIDQYGEPDKMMDSQLIWHHPGPWKRIVASKNFFQRDFPAPHTDSVESVIDYRVPPAKFSELAKFDGSIVVERTAGEVSARCHDEQANFLALNLMHDIVTEAKTPQEARNYYAKEFADYRRKKRRHTWSGCTSNPALGRPRTRTCGSCPIRISGRRSRKVRRADSSVVTRTPTVNHMACRHARPRQGRQFSS
jgi:hypothetical protein